jgi:hypothetical protein
MAGLCPGHPHLNARKNVDARHKAGMTAEALFRRALGGLGKFLQHAVALQLRQMIHEQHAV